MTDRAEAYRVTIRHNMVLGVAKVPDGDPGEDNLAAGTRLAMNHQRNGCIDGDYDFSSIHTAKDFAVLSLDFVVKLAEKGRADLEAHNFYAEPAWVNGLVSGSESGSA